LKQINEKTEEILTEWSSVTLFDLQKAIHKKMRQYPGGIKGIWEAIDPYYKCIEGDKNTKKINKSDFLRAVSRLNEKGPENENMTFGIKGNLLLTLNIFDILGLIKRDEIIKVKNKKRYFKGYIFDSYRRVKDLEKKINDLSGIFEQAFRRPPRFTAYKIAKDWENILYRVKEIIDGNIDPVFQENYFKVAPFQERAMFYNLVISKFRNSPFHISVYSILFDYNYYFYQDKIIYSHIIKELKDNSLIKIVNKDDNIYLYFLYCFLQMNKRFLNMISKEDEKMSTETFKLQDHLIFNNNDEIINNEDIKRKYLQKSVTVMLKNVKKTIGYIGSRKLTEEESLEYKEILHEIVDVFYDIYLNKTDVKEETIPQLVNKIESLEIEKIFSLITLSRFNIFYVPSIYISKLEILKNRISNNENMLLRNYLK